MNLLFINYNYFISFITLISIIGSSNIPLTRRLESSIKNTTTTTLISIKTTIIAISNNNKAKKKEVKKKKGKKDSKNLDLLILKSSIVKVSRSI